MPYHSTAHVAITSLIFNDFIKNMSQKYFFFFGFLTFSTPFIFISKIKKSRKLNKKKRKGKYYLITQNFSKSSGKS